MLLQIMVRGHTHLLCHLIHLILKTIISLIWRMNTTRKDPDPQMMWPHMSGTDDHSQQKYSVLLVFISFLFVHVSCIFKILRNIVWIKTHQVFFRFIFLLFWAVWSHLVWIQCKAIWNNKCWRRKKQLKSHYGTKLLLWYWLHFLWI